MWGSAETEPVPEGSSSVAGNDLSPIRVSPFLEFQAPAARGNLGGKRVAEKPYSVDP